MKKKKKSNKRASINNTFKEEFDKYTDIKIRKISDEIWFINDAIQMQLLRNTVIEVMIKQMYAKRPLELQTELIKPGNFKYTKTTHNS